MFRRTLTPKDGDSMSITFFTKNLLARMGPNALPFSVFHFIWKEIKSIAQSPLKNCGNAPHLMYMIESVPQTKFVKDVKHKSLKVIRMKDPIVPRGPGESSSAPPPPVGASGEPSQGVGEQGQRGSQWEIPHMSGDKPPSPIRRMFNMVFGMCVRQQDIDEKAHLERQARRREGLTDTQRDIHSCCANAQPPPQEQEVPSSPPPRSIESYIEEWQQQDPYSQYYGTQSSMTYGYMPAPMGGPSVSVPPPPPPAPVSATEAFTQSAMQQGSNSGGGIDGSLDQVGDAPFW